MLKLVTSLLASMLLVVSVGCNSESQSPVGDVELTPTTVANVLCGTCGHEKGSAECCTDECTLCEKCGLHADSLLCCAVSAELQGKDMCSACGHEAGSEACCSDDCAKCEKCGLHADSPLCCKLTDDSGEATPAAE